MVRFKLKGLRISISLIAIIAGLFFGGFAIVSNGLCVGLSGTIFAIILVQVTLNVYAVPEDEKICTKAALDHFRHEYPDERISGVYVRDTNAERFIVDVRYGRGRPGPRMYFAVSRSDQTVTAEDRLTWWPTGTK